MDLALYLIISIPLILLVTYLLFERKFRYQIMARSLRMKSSGKASGTVTLSGSYQNLRVTYHFSPKTKSQSGSISVVMDGKSNLRFSIRKEPIRAEARESNCKAYLPEIDTSYIVYTPLIKEVEPYFKKDSTQILLKMLFDFPVRSFVVDSARFHLELAAEENRIKNKQILYLTETMYKLYRIGKGDKQVEHLVQRSYVPEVMGSDFSKEEFERDFRTENISTLKSIKRQQKDERRSKSDSKKQTRKQNKETPSENKSFKDEESKLDTLDSRSHTKNQEVGSESISEQKKPFPKHREDHSTIDSQVSENHDPVIPSENTKKEKTIATSSFNDASQQSDEQLFPEGGEYTSKPPKPHGLAALDTTTLLGHLRTNHITVTEFAHALLSKPITSLETVVRQLKDRALRPRLIKALSQLDERVLPVLIPQLTDAALAPYIRSVLAELNPNVQTAIKDWLKETTDSDLLVILLELLGQYKIFSAQDSIKKLIYHQEFAVRLQAEKTLRIMGWKKQDESL